MSAKTIIRIAQSLFATYGDSKFNLIAYTVWTAASVFVLQLQTFTGSQSQSGMPATIEDRDDSVKLAMVAKGMLGNICQYCTGIERITSILASQLAKLGIDPEATPEVLSEHDKFPETSTLQPMASMAEIGLSDSENMDFPINFGIAHDGRDEFIESLMNSFLS